MKPLDDLNSRFDYQSETETNGGKRSRIERWRILKGDGYLRGDCEDYSLTLIWLMEDRSMWKFWLAIWTFKYRLWHCVSPGGVGHAILYHDGKWIDNIQRKWMDASPKSLGYKMRFPMIAPYVAIKMLISWVMKKRTPMDDHDKMMYAASGVSLLGVVTIIAVVWYFIYGSST